MNEAFPEFDRFYKQPRQSQILGNTSKIACNPFEVTLAIPFCLRFRSLKSPALTVELRSREHLVYRNFSISEAAEAIGSPKRTFSSG